MIANRALLATLLSCLVACSSCASEPGEGPIGTVQDAIIKGTASDALQNAVVMILRFDGSTNSAAVCTGTMLAPRLVLTARHCVSDTQGDVNCSEGTPISGGTVRNDHDPKTMYVFAGERHTDFMRSGVLEPSGIVAKIVHDGAENTCNHDIALLVLEEPIKDVPISPIRLDGDVTVGERITALGWGVTDQTPQPAQRQQRANVKIRTVGPDASDKTVAPNEFHVGESICTGDSGGPAFAQETNAVVGVASRGGNGRPSANDPAAICIDGKNLFTKTAPFKDLLLKGYELAEAEPWLEGGPDPRKLKSKESCEGDDDCRSALCLPDPDAAYERTCAEDCSATQACTVEGEVCTVEGDANVCRAPSPEPPTSAGACTAAPGRSAFGIGVTIVVGMLAVASLRRHRRRCLFANEVADAARTERAIGARTSEVVRRRPYDPVHRSHPERSGAG